MSDTKSLREKIGTPPTRERVVAECCTLIDEQVKSKSGMSGIVIKAGYGTIKAIKKGFVAEVVDGMLDDWMDNMQPYYDSWARNRTGSFAEHLTARSQQVADDLLRVTDQRAERTKHAAAKKGYTKLRGSAQKHVAEAVPALAQLVDRHLG